MRAGLSDDRPISLRCGRCQLLKEVTPRLETETGDMGHTVSAWLEYAVEPACLGWVDHEDLYRRRAEAYRAEHPEHQWLDHGPYVDEHAYTPESEDECPACLEVSGRSMCPFDGRDDYGRDYEEVVSAVLRDRKRYGRAPEAT